MGARLTGLPGDPSHDEIVAGIVRVDQAGELAARNIYRGQLAVMAKDDPQRPLIQHMLDQELLHLERFNRLLTERKVRPTLMQPLWEAAAFTLGAATALMGPKAAMACTAAVEEVIDEHYARQRSLLGETEPELSEMIEQFRCDEVEHRDTAQAHGAADAPFQPLLSAAIKAGCRAAIRISEKL